MQDEENDNLVLDFGVDNKNWAQLHIEAESNFDEGDYELALMQYLQVFDGSRAEKSWQEKRLTILLADLAALADVYEAAMQTITGMRDQREAELISGGGDLASLSEWAALNDQLQPERTLNVYFKLKQESSKYAHSLSLIRQIEASHLIKNGQYQELDKTTLEYLQQKLQQREIDLLSPDVSAELADEDQEELIESALEEVLAATLELFEAAAALKEGDIGRETMNKYLAYDQPDKYSKLITAARRAKNKIWIDGLEKLAADTKQQSN